MPATMKRLVVLGGGAVVRECFLPALDALGILDRVTIVDSNPKTPDLGAQYPAAKFLCVDFRNWLSRSCNDEYFAAVIALPNILH